MTSKIQTWLSSFMLAALAATALPGCSDSSDAKPVGETAEAGSRFVLGSVVIDADGNRTTYVQAVPTLDGPFDNESAIELAGDGVLMAGGKDFFVGLAEEPTWVRYSVDGAGTISESGRMSLANIGAKYIDFGNAYIDSETAVSIFTSPTVAIIWNPSTMEVTQEIDLSALEKDGLALEVWTTVAHDGLVYIPGRYADWDNGIIFPGVSLTVLDPKAQKVLGTATDDRCASGGRVLFDKDGYGYVMGDGRTYSIQMFANVKHETAPQNCLLRIAPGAIEFDKDYYYPIPSLTGGIEAIGELEGSGSNDGFGFATLFYPDHLPPGVEPVDFDFWSVPAHKLWRLNLTDPPTAEEVDGIPFSAIGFGGAALGGHLYEAQSDDGSSSDVYEIDAETNQASLRFKMVGYFNGLFELKK